MAFIWRYTSIDRYDFTFKQNHGIYSIVCFFIIITDTVSYGKFTKTVGPTLLKVWNQITDAEIWQFVDETGTAAAVRKISFELILKK